MSSFLSFSVPVSVTRCGKFRTKSFGHTVFRSFEISLDAVESLAHVGEDVVDVALGGNLWNKKKTSWV